MDNNLYIPNIELHTPRLILRWLDKSDRDLIFALHSDLRVIRYTGIAQYLDIAQADDFMQRIEQDMKNNKSLTWAMFLSATGHSIGTICFWNLSDDKKDAELGYDLLPDYWGQSYVLEAILAVLDFGFKHCGFDNIYAYPRSVHTASCRVLEKTGFRFVKEVDTDHDDGVYRSSVYKITENELS